MKNAFWAYWLILLGVFIVVIMLLVQNLTTSSTQDYYLVKEITDASLIDAVDYSYYRTYGEIKINKEKFYESFLRRFAETASLSTTYTVSFYGVYEAPPKVSVEIKSQSNVFNVVGDATEFDIVQRIDAILEGNTIDENAINNSNNSTSNGSTNRGTSNNNSGTSNNQTENNNTIYYTVSFNVKTACTERNDAFYGGLSPLRVKAGEYATKPSDPYLALNYCATCTGNQSVSPQKFVEWRLNGVRYNFDTPVNSDITLDAVWDTGNNCR